MLEQNLGMRPILFLLIFRAGVDEMLTPRSRLVGNVYSTQLIKSLIQHAWEGPHSDVMPAWPGVTPQTVLKMEKTQAKGKQEVTFQPSGPRRCPISSQATMVPATDPIAPITKAPNVVLAALSSLQD